MYFPNRLELSLRMVLAFPKAVEIERVIASCLNVLYIPISSLSLTFKVHYSSFNILVCFLQPNVDLKKSLLRSGWNNICQKYANKDCNIAFSHPQGSGWLPTPAVRSKSAAHWWQPETARSTWCSPSSLLQTHHWQIKHAGQVIKLKYPHMLLISREVCISFCPKFAYLIWHCNYKPMSKNRRYLIFLLKKSKSSYTNTHFFPNWSIKFHYVIIYKTSFFPMQVRLDYKCSTVPLLVTEVVVLSFIPLICVFHLEI